MDIKTAMEATAETRERERKQDIIEDLRGKLKTEKENALEANKKVEVLENTIKILEGQAT